MMDDITNLWNWKHVIAIPKNKECNHDYGFHLPYQFFFQQALLM